MNKRTFNYFSREKSVPCPAGERFKQTHVLVRKNGNLSLRPSGKIDTVEQIQSYHDGVSLAKMVERFKRGDTSALNQRAGFYADVSGFDDDPQAVIENTRALMESAPDQSPAPDQTPVPDQSPAPDQSPVPDSNNNGGDNNAQS